MMWIACGLALLCAPMGANATTRFDTPQEKVQKKEVPNPEKAAQRRTDEMDKMLDLTEKQYKKIYKLFLKEEKERVEALMERHPGGMNGQPPMGGRPPRGEGRPPMGGGMPPQGGGFPGMGEDADEMTPEERMKAHVEEMQKEQEKREKKSARFSPTNSMKSGRLGNRRFCRRCRRATGRDRVLANGERERLHCRRLVRSELTVSLDGRAKGELSLPSVFVR